MSKKKYLDEDDRLLWESGQAIVVIEKDSNNHLKFKKTPNLFNYLKWWVDNNKADEIYKKLIIRNYCISNIPRAIGCNFNRFN